MAELKTKLTNADVSDFINAFADSEQKREEIVRHRSGCTYEIDGRND